MARQINWKPRLIYPTCTTSASLNSKSALAEILWWRLIACADDQGRLSGIPKSIKAEYVPFRPEIFVENIPGLLDELKEDMIAVYGDPPVIQILNWWAWEHPQWSYPSFYPCLDGWVDHLRYQSSKQIVTINWPPPKSTGALPKPSESPPGSALPRPLPRAVGSKIPSHLGSPKKLEEEEEEKEEEEEDIPAVAGDSKPKTRKPQPATTTKARKETDPEILDMFKEMQSFLGYPDRTKHDPIPSPGREGQAIKRMKARGFTRVEILGCWKAKVSQCGGEFVSMTWVNQDIGRTHAGAKQFSKAGGGAAGSQPPTDKERKDSIAKALR